MITANEGYYDENGDYVSPSYSEPAVLKQSGFSNLFNSLGGFLSKTVDTAGDALALAGANKIVGSVYPTGQQNPMQNTAQKSPNTANPNNAVNYTPYLIAGGAVLGVVLLVAVLRK